MKKTIFATILLALLLTALSGQAQMRRSDKRGYSDNGPYYSQHAIEALAPGVSWTYNWAVDPERQPANLGGSACDINYAPMCWNGNYDATRLNTYLSNNDGTRYLLGFNEPNFSSQANMTPAQAAEKWPELEALAEQYGTALVSPALNFSGERVGGRVWQPVDWLDAFIAEYNNLYDHDPRMDYIALHCYMDYAAAVDWYVNKYLYVDNYNDNYPNLKRYFDEHGQTPLLLTEFCAWENNNGNLNADFQVQSMVEKLQVLELSEHVAGYCWFMGHGNNNYGYPYYRMFESNADDSPLTRLGTIYVHSSSFDRECFFAPGQRIAAKDYIYMSGGTIDLNTDSESDVAVEFSQFSDQARARYQVDLPHPGVYTINIRLNLAQGRQAALSVMSDDQLMAQQTLTAALGGWQTYTVHATLDAGRHTLEMVNTGSDPCGFNWFQLDYVGESSVENLSALSQPCGIEYYNLQGQRTLTPQPGICIVVTRMSDGNTQVSKQVKP